MYFLSRANCHSWITGFSQLTFWSHAVFQTIDYRVPPTVPPLLTIPYPLPTYTQVTPVPFPVVNYRAASMGRPAAKTFGLGLLAGIALAALLVTFVVFHQESTQPRPPLRLRLELANNYVPTGVIKIV